MEWQLTNSMRLHQNANFSKVMVTGLSAQMIRLFPNVIYLIKSVTVTELSKQLDEIKACIASQMAFGSHTLKEDSVSMVTM